MQSPPADLLTTIKDIVGIIAPVVTAIIAGWGLWIAQAGLRKWQTEEPGKRKLAVAEEALRLTYAVERALQHVRSSLVHSAELVVERDGKPVQISPYEAMLNRYDTHLDLLRKFRDHRALYGVYYGREAMKDFDEISLLVNEIVVDIDHLRQYDGREASVEERYRLADIRAKIRLGSADTPNKFDERLDAAIETLRQKFESVVFYERRKRGVQ